MTAATKPGADDTRWAVNYLLEQIANKFDAWDTLDLWRCDAASLVRSYKHDLSVPEGLATKPDGGVEGHADPQGSGHRSKVGGDAGAKAMTTAGIKAGPSGPADGEDDPLVDLANRFSAALLEKLQAARVKYGYDESWQEAGWEADCQKNLISHLAKGDPRDVAAYCAFMWHHGWATGAAPVGEPMATKKTYIKPLRTIVEIQAVYADQIRDLLNTAPPPSVTASVDFLSAMESNCWTLRCIDIPTGAGAGDGGWEVVEHHMAKPHDRVVGNGSSPREALLDAISRAEGN